MRVEELSTKLLLIGLIGIVFLAYGLNRGIYVGSDNVVMRMPCCPSLDTIEKRCHYLFVTGISTIYADQGRIFVRDILSADSEKLMELGATEKEISAWLAAKKDEGSEELLSRRPDLDNGFCRLFGS